MEGACEFDIVVADPHGFCSGVKNAIKIAEQTLESSGEPIYCYHELVHNHIVVDRLVAKGMRFISSIEDVPVGGTVLFSAHGVSPEIREKAKVRNLKVIDATCVFVQRLHDVALSYVRDGKTVILVGNVGHDEVEGIRGEAADAIKVVSTPEEIAALEIDDDGEVAILSQTTITRHQVDTVVEAARKRFPKLERPSRIGMCFATEERQEAVRAFAGNVDFVIVLGSKSSANSNRLVDVAREAGLKAILVSDVEDLDRFVKSGALQGLRKIGITAGASTPEDVIDGVIEYLSSFKAGQ